MDDVPYHERQRLQHCAVHALNNLLGGPRFTSTSLAAISDSIVGARRQAGDPSRRAGANNPSRPPACPPAHPAPCYPGSRTWWLGNFDVNVLSAALLGEGFELVGGTGWEGEV